MTQEKIVFLIKLLEEILCFYIAFPYIGIVRPTRKKTLWLAYLILFLWAFGKNIVVVIDPASRGMINTITILYECIGGLLVAASLGRAYEDGIIRAVIAILLSDICMGGLTVVTVFLSAVFRGASFSETFASVGRSYTVDVLIMGPALFLLLLYLFRKPLKSFRQIPLNSYPAAWIIVPVYVLITANPALHWSAVPGMETGSMNILVLYYTVFITIAVIIVYYLRAGMIARHNLMIAQQNQLLKEQMLVLREHTVAVRKLRHDIRRHLNVLQWSSDDEAVRRDSQPDMQQRRASYRDQLMHMYNRLQSGVYSGAPDIDAILSSLDRYCRKKGYSCRIQLRQLETDSLTENAGQTLLLYVIYWVMDRCEGIAADKNVSVALSGAMRGDMNTLLAKVSCTAGIFNQRQMQEDLIAEMRKLLGSRGSVDMRTEDGTDSLWIEWQR